MKLLIFYLTNSQRHYTFPHYIKLLNQSLKKDQWKLLILANDEPTEFYKNEIETNTQGINYASVSVYDEYNNNYMAKAKYANEMAAAAGIPYMMKCDNDIFLKPDALDYMIDNLNILENPAHLTLGPVLTTGIPGVEYFIDQFLDPAAKKHLEIMFTHTPFYPICGVDYSFLNKFTVDNPEQPWDKTAFFDAVKKMNHHYKGIHPIRVKIHNIGYLNDYIIANKARFMEPKTMGLITTDNSPYLCNSIYCIKTETYHKILNTPELYVDVFDEVPLNKYAYQNNMNHVFVENGFAIHMYYNWAPNYIEHERHFCKMFFEENK